MSEQAARPVRDFVTTAVKTIDGLASVTDAMVMMRQGNVSSLVIDKRHDGDEYGLLVVHDIAEKVLGPDRSPDRVSVYEIMSKPAVTVDAGMDIRYAIRLLSRLGLSRALVLDSGAMVGIVTLRDMVLRG